MCLPLKCDPIIDVIFEGIKLTRLCTAIAEDQLFLQLLLSCTHYVCAVFKFVLLK